MEGVDKVWGEGVFAQPAALGAQHPATATAATLDARVTKCPAHAVARA